MYLSDASLDRLLQEGNVTITQTLSENYTAHVSIKTGKKGVTKVWVVLYDNRTGKPVERLGQCSAKVNKTSKLKYTVRNLCNQIMERVDQENAEKKRVKTRKPGDQTFGAAVLSVPDIMEPGNYVAYTGRLWHRSTLEQAVTYLAETFGPFFDQHHYVVTDADFKKFMQECEQKIMSGKSKKMLQKVELPESKRKQIHNGLMDRWRRAGVILMWLKEHHPEMGWPDCEIPVEGRYRVSREEEVKSIPYRVYITLTVLMRRLCARGLGIAFAGLGEVFGYMRVGESAALCVGELALDNGFCSCWVSHQLDDDGNRIDILKTESSYRRLVFTSGMVDLVCMRHQQLLDAGFSEEEIPSLPLGSDLRNVHTFYRKEAVSEFLRKMLVLSGCDESWIVAAAQEVFGNRQTMNEYQDVEVTAHLCRRALATVFYNGGMPLTDLNEQMGHQDDKRKRNDYASSDKQREIACVQDRALYLGEQFNTFNANYKEVKLDGNASYFLKGNTGYSFRAEEDMYINVDLESLESDDPIILELPEEIDVNQLVLREIYDTPERMRARPFLPRYQDRDEVEEYIKEANAIPLDGFFAHGKKA